MARGDLAQQIREFQQVVPIEFAPLIATYNLKITWTSYNLGVQCDLTSQQCGIVVLLDRGDIYTTLKPADISQVPKPRVGIPRSFDLMSIVLYLDPQAHDGPFASANVTTIQQELHAIVGLINTYCSPLLDGDFSIWPQLSEEQQL